MQVHARTVERTGHVREPVGLEEKLELAGILAVFGAGEAKCRFVACAAAHRDTARGQPLPARPGVAWLAALPSRKIEGRDTTSSVLAKYGNIVTRADCACQRNPDAGRTEVT